MRTWWDGPTQVWVQVSHQEGTTFDDDVITQDTPGIVGAQPGDTFVRGTNAHHPCACSVWLGRQR